MRLWNYELLPELPQQWLLGQHRECCALRGLGWGKKHKIVNYVFNNNYMTLYKYHFSVMRLLQNKYNSNINEKWFNAFYRGKKLRYSIILPNFNITTQENYLEHDNNYYIECCNILIEKFENKFNKTLNIKYLYLIENFLNLRDIKNNTIKKELCYITVNSVIRKLK